MQKKETIKPGINDILHYIQPHRRHKKGWSRSGKACKECGICAKGCPAGAISLNDLKHSDKSKCISACPSGARAINPVMHFMVKTMLKGPCKERKALELFI